MSDPAAFMAAAPAPMNSNTAWGARYAGEIRRVVRQAASHAPRTLQRHLGPSELGVACDRQVAGKLAGLAATNHVADPWPSVIGTATHAWLADAFTFDNTISSVLRWVTEQRVAPHPDHSGTADLYDAMEQAVIDHKILGKTTLEMVKSAGGPPRHYVVQLLLYALGYRNLGLPVKRVVLAAYPRTQSSLDGLYVWDHEIDPEADSQLLAIVFAQTATRKQYAQQLVNSQLSLVDIPATPSDHECYFCPYFRPESANDNGYGCPGHRGATQHTVNSPQYTDLGK